MSFSHPSAPARPTPLAPALTPLLCPACGGALDPLPDDVLFLCPGCGGASELAAGSPRSREVRFLASPSGEVASIYLPLWSFEENWITPAFNGSRLLTLTKWYSQRRAACTAPGEASVRPLWGGRIGAQDAWRVCLLAHDAKPAHGADPDRDLQTGGSAPPGPRTPPTLLGVPYRTAPSHLVCALTGLHIYRETLEGAADLLARWDRWSAGV